MSKMYKREGRRFVEVQDVTGMYLQEDGTFQVAKDNCSIGICVLQTMSIRKVVSLFPHTGSWNDCAVYCKLGRILDYPAHMPTRQEMYLAQQFVQQRKLPQRIYWTAEESCSSSNNAWRVYFYLSSNFGDCYDRNKNFNGTVLAFVNIPI